MKIIIISFILTIQSALAIDQAGIDQIKSKGYIVTMGEFTGAGSKMSRVAGFIHPQGIIMKADCKNILVKKESNQNDIKVSDITKIVVDQSVLNASEFEGFFSFQ